MKIYLITVEFGMNMVARKKASIGQRKRDINAKYAVAYGNFDIQNFRLLDRLKRLKRLHILAERYRNRRKRFGLRLSLFCGLHNFELTNG